MDGGVNIGAGVRGNHPPEQRPLQPAGQRRRFPKSAEVAALAAPGVKQIGGGISSGFGIFGVFGADGGGLLLQVLHFRQTQQQRLPARFAGAAAAVHPDVESTFHGGDYLIRNAAGLPQRIHHPPFHHIAGADGALGALNAMQGELILRRPPVPLQALRGNPRPHRAAELHPLGQAGIVPVQQRRRVGMQGMDLQKARDGRHRGSSPCLISRQCCPIAPPPSGAGPCSIPGPSGGGTLRRRPRQNRSCG